MSKKINYKYLEIDHLAGIVPIGGIPLDFKMPWHDSLIPIGPNYLAIERAVYECAVAGCDTIWIVGHKGTSPIVRKRLGDFIVDPVTLFPKNPYSKKKDIPIFYVPILPRDFDKRDSLGWSVLHGADCAFRVSCFISKWTAPKRFYCSFPYGISSLEFIRDYRLNFKRDEKNIIFSHNSKTVKDNLHIPFLFNADDYKKCRDIVKKKNIDDWQLRKEKNAREFTLAEVFEPLDAVNNSVIELPWFHDISSWKKYCDYAASDEAKNIVKHDSVFTKEKRKLFPTEKEILERNREEQTDQDEGKLEEKV